MNEIDEKVAEKIEQALSLEHISGVVIIKKDKTPAISRKLIDDIVGYIKQKGYNTDIMENNQEYHIIPILKSF